ncbi:MAG: hypothetical protein EXS30_11800, partial [Pedosphaera sp.]|nr:hypothetical protein [Pedosphaera sp.]
MPSTAATARNVLIRRQECRSGLQQKHPFIIPASGPVEGLQQVQSGLVGRIAKLYEQGGRAQRIGTVDQDATILESH